ncbi:MAG TPA: TetR/AcrR family transcriptional regulator [Syntrophomonadaceae bacterium]|nr:TetR/AcrR family transcriptional regulator [Syntrophomonadaceae bacterium]HQA07539.1 TetR/AcrR family transcriptional regulator [Syntrophomonadaceae bacterium]HQE22278.1 TetR/AcrR family transcriptional regulator [Syntrophomonadaceae bacterium]
MEDKDFTPKEKLIYEALKEFADRGFDSASLNQIIKRAGISKGSFYHHFANKEELFNNVIHRAAQEKLAFISQWIVQNCPGHETLGFFDQLRLQMAGGIEFARQRPELSAFLLNVLKNPELKAKALALMPAYYDQAFDAAVTEAQQKGELRQDMDPEFTKKLLKYTLMALGQLILDSSDGDLDQAQIKQQTDYYMEFLQNGLGASKDK